MSELLPQIQRSCVFSPDRQYRFELHIIHPEIESGVVNFLMLNPSTADEIVNDPTIERCQRRAFIHGILGRKYREVVITNIFAFRSTDPKALRDVADPIGLNNDSHIKGVAMGADLVICGWGEHGSRFKRSGRVAQMLKEARVSLFCLGVNASGHPKHPLYVAYAEDAREWKA